MVPLLPIDEKFGLQPNEIYLVQPTSCTGGSTNGTMCVTSRRIVFHDHLQNRYLQLSPLKTKVTMISTAKTIRFMFTIGSTKREMTFTFLNEFPKMAAAVVASRMIIPPEEKVPNEVKRWNSVIAYAAKTCSISLFPEKKLPVNSLEPNSYALSVGIIHSLFKASPILHGAFQLAVPHYMTDIEFWTIYVCVFVKSHP